MSPIVNYSKKLLTLISQLDRLTEKVTNNANALGTLRVQTTKLAQQSISNRDMGVDFRQRTNDKLTGTNAVIGDLCKEISSLKDSIDSLTRKTESNQKEIIALEKHIALRLDSDAKQREIELLKLERRLTNQLFTRVPRSDLNGTYGEPSSQLPSDNSLR